MPGKASKLVKDLSNVPSIVGSLGLSVAEAQKAFNLDYLDNIERLLGMIKGFLDPKNPDGAELTADEQAKVQKAETQVKALLKQLAPSRYQFTETTLAVKLDLAQTLDVGASAGFSAGVGAVALNAALSVGFGYDYRAAAEVRTSIHAIPPDETTFNTLLGRAKEISATALTLPAGAQIDQKVLDQSHGLVQKMSDVEIKPPVVAADTDE